MWRSCVLAIFALQIVLSASGARHYSVIGPGVIHPEHKYTVAVAVHDTTVPCKLKIGITSPKYKEYKIVELNTADEVKLVEFDIPELEKADFKLTAKGIEGMKFSNTTQLIYEHFEPYVNIQTDKGVYKPSDVVQFRVIFLDENLKPFTVKNSTYIFFEDSARNRVKEFRNLTPVNGVYTGKFQISEFAALGNWRIKVQRNDNQMATVYFDVKKYVLPIYDITLEATKHVSLLDGDMQVVVRANYTYGKPVNGQVLLTAEVDWNDEPDTQLPHLISTANMVDGKAKFDLSVRQYAGRFIKKQPRLMQILATLEEEFTGVQINATTVSILYPYRYNIRCVDWNVCSTYHADKEQEVIIKILHVDNTLVENTSGTAVRLTYTEEIIEAYDYEHRRPRTGTVRLSQHMQSFTFESRLNASSMAKFNVKLPDLQDIEGYQHVFKTEIEFKEQKDAISVTHPYRATKELRPQLQESKDYFKIETEYDNDAYSFKVGQEAVFLVNSSVPLKYFVYTLVGRGNIMKIERVMLREPSKTHKLQIFTTMLTMPIAMLYVHYVENDEYHFAETLFRVDYESENRIEISLPEEVKIGEVVQIQISTAPKSFVGLLGVDQSVLLMKQNNDIYEEDLKWRLREYSTRTPAQGGYSAYPGQISGLITLTNANYFYNRTQPLWFEGYVSPDALPVEHNLPTMPVDVPSSPAAAIRRNFAETWIFDNIESTEAENFMWSKQIPDTITSWALSGFSINADKGFATTKARSYVKAFQSFFISIRLPYSVKRGEVISVPALVFNYLEYDLNVRVTLDNTHNEFDFIGVSDGGNIVPIYTKLLFVPANSAKGVSFMIRPKIIGNILLKFTATSPSAGDAIHKTLKVVPEGITEYANRAYFVNLKHTNEFSETFQLELPEEIVPDSDHAEFNIAGDVLEPIFNNLDSLVRMPTGCGEQTMSTFVYNYLAFCYLKKSNRITAELEPRIKNNLESGYQNMLRFRHEDGSFSSFGPGLTVDNAPRKGSTWLTAYVTRFLQAARDHVHSDYSNIIFEAHNFLGLQQAANGSFTEAGEYFFRSQNHEISLTSTVLLTFLGSDYQHARTQLISDAFKFIERNIEKTTDLRAKALATYTLKQGKHRFAAKYLNELKALAKSDVERKWWSAVEDNVKQSPYFHHGWRRPISQDVEVTAYVLLSLLDDETETVDSVLPIVKWLIGQRNNQGGFSSTHDTVVGLQALIKFAEKCHYEPGRMYIEFTAIANQPIRTAMVEVTKQNAQIMQTYELPSKTHAVEFRARGIGAALVQVSYQYNVYETEKTPSFKLYAEIDKVTLAHKLMMDVCVEYVGTDSESNMALLEVSLPSGYIAHEDSLAELHKVERVRHIELTNSNTNIVVYFESLLRNDVKCLTIEALRSFAVAEQKPAPIVVYDYYDTTKRATTYYEVSSKICEICDREDAECKRICG